MTCNHSTWRRRGIRFGFRLQVFALAAVVSLAAAWGQSSNSGPRGQPIRPPASRLTNAPPAGLNPATVVTLPGGVVITNLPGEFLPRSPTNMIRLPARAARKFEPLGYLPINFTILARFFLRLPEPGATPAARWDAVWRQIPEEIQAMNNRKVALVGFVLPMTVANGRSTEFLLLRTQSACCFGMVPRVNELVIVKVAPPGIAPRPDTPMVVAGTLKLKWIGEGDQLTAIYEMQGDRVETAAGF